MTYSDGITMGTEGMRYSYVTSSLTLTTTSDIMFLKAAKS